MKKFTRCPVCIAIFGLTGIIILGVLLIRLWASMLIPDKYEIASPVFYDMITGSKTVTLLFQNNTELRPGGGFLGSFMEISLFYGIPYGASFHNSYDITSTVTKEDPNTPNPPKVLDEHFSDTKGYKGYTFRDANWNPDFSENAKDLLYFYESYIGNTPDYIMVIQFTAVEELSKIVGPVTLGNSTITKHNLFDVLEYETKNFDKHSLQGHKDRKNILGALFSIYVKTLIKKAIFHPSEIERFLQNMLSQKLMYIYANKKQNQKILENASIGGSFDKPVYVQFDGKVPGYQGEYNANFYDIFGANLANLSARKSDRYLHKNITYHVFLDTDGQIYIKTQFSYEHTGQYNGHSTKYTWYQRSFVPYGAKLQAMYGDYNNQNFAYLGKANIDQNRQSINQNPKSNLYTQNYVYKIFDNYVSVAPKRETYFGYDMVYPNKKPQNMEDGMVQSYHLALIEQPGNIQDFYNVRIEVPNGYRLHLENTNAKSVFTRKEVINYQGELTQNTYFDISVKKEQTPPIILDQKVSKDLDEVHVYFSEPIRKKSLRPEIYSIRDTDAINPQTSDTVSINNWELIDKKQLTLYIDGMTKQKEEAYKLTMRGITDTQGNELAPNPHTVTIIQGDFTF